MTIKCNTDKQLSLISLEILEITLNSRNSLLIELECVPTKDTPMFKIPFLNLLSLIYRSRDDRLAGKCIIYKSLSFVFLI